MTTKRQGGYAQDGSKYTTIVNGSGTIVTLNSSDKGTDKRQGTQAPDGSIYITLTDGSGNLT